MTRVSQLIVAAAVLAPALAAAQPNVIRAVEGPIVFTPLQHASLQVEYDGRTYQIDPAQGDATKAKQADLVLVAGDPSNTIADVRKVDTVFRKGVGYDPQKLTDSVKGKMGIW